MKHKKVFTVLSMALLIIVLQADVAFGTVGTPTVVKQGYGLGADLKQGSNYGTGTWNKVHFDFTFMYDGDTSTLKAFRLYEKKPGMAGFSQAVEFNNLLAVSSSESAVSGAWSISRLNTTWIISKRDQTLLTTRPVALYEPISAYPTGVYSYYVTAVDSGGYEGFPSQTYNLHVLDPIQILNPAPSSIVSLTPNLQWTVVSGWPDNQVLYIIKINDSHTVTWTKTLINKTGELLYSGDPLDPAKKYMLHIQGQWTSNTFYPLDTFFAGSTQDVTFQVSVSVQSSLSVPAPTPISTPTPPPSLTPAPVPTPIPPSILSAPSISTPMAITKPHVAPIIKPKVVPPSTRTPKKEITPASVESSEKITPSRASTSEQKNIEKTLLIPPAKEKPKPQGFFSRFWQAVFSLFIRSMKKSSTL